MMRTLSETLVDDWRNLPEENQSSYLKKAARKPDPVTAHIRPDSNFGAVTEAVEGMIEEYLSNKEGLDEKEFKVRKLARVCPVTTQEVRVVIWTDCRA